jgi:hypothetical protein
MEELIKSIHADWLKAKARAQRRCERAGMTDVAKKIADCNVFTGCETLPELVDLMFSPQGVEFMTAFGFPNIRTFRRFIPYHPEQYGVFIDAQNITCDGVERVYLIGNTSARIKCAETRKYAVVLMHGARAVVDAAGYSVVRIERDASSTAKVNKTNHAIVI